MARRRTRSSARANCTHVHSFSRVLIAAQPRLIFRAIHVIAVALMSRANISKGTAVIRCFVAAIASVPLMAAAVPASTEPATVPAEIIFPSTVGAVTFHHEMHYKDLAIKCVVCHHAIEAKILVTPHPDYLKSSAIKCEICHRASAATTQKIYTCSVCHPTNPANIADETLSAKVVVHERCWSCHQEGRGKDASAGCEKCHSGKKTF
jgi:Zn finger protein HypA/HybF involved in hydrogenase expression